MQHYVSLPNSEIEKKISEYIHSERDRRIMRMRFIDGLTYDRIAEQIEMSSVQIQRIVTRCKNYIGLI